MDKNILVGVNYFSGWWRPLPNKYIIKGKDWRMDYKERIPLLGAYNDSETMDAEIIAASDYAIDYFQFLWYVEEPERHPHGKRLNDGLRNFLNSPFNNKMKFCLEFCNHPPFELTNDEIWKQTCIFWTDIMKHPSYLRIEGKAVFKIHGYDYFKAQCGTVQKYKKYINILRETAQKNGAGELLIGAGITSMKPFDISEEIYYKNLDWVGAYMWVPDYPQKEELYPYEKLASGSIEFLRGWKNASLPYAPYIPAGWNPRPWGDPRAAFENPSYEQLTNILYTIKEMLRNGDSYNIANKKMLTIYAWNEFGEGGYLAPTAGEGYLKLDAVKNIFS